MERSEALKLSADDVTPSNLLAVARALRPKDEPAWDLMSAAMYGVRRLLAVEKDKARRKSGAMPERLYSPDTSEVTDLNEIPAVLGDAQDGIAQAQEELDKRRARKSRKAVKSEARPS